MAQQQKAKAVYDREYYLLMDDTEVEVKPLPIKKLRKATNLINNAIKGHPVTNEDGEPVYNENGEPQTQVDDEELIDALLQVVVFVMEDRSNVKACEKFLEPDDGRELLEETIDQTTMYEIVRVATGYDFLKMSKMVEEMMQTGVTL